MTTPVPRRPRRVVLVLAIVLGILGMHALMAHAAHGGQDAGPMAGMAGMAGMGHSMAVDAAVLTHLAGDARQAVFEPAVDTGGMPAGFMVCALMIAGGLVIALAGRRGTGRVLRRPAAARAPSAPVPSGWLPPGSGSPPTALRFSVVRC